MQIFFFATCAPTPWVALLRMRERWTELSFNLVPSYLDALPTH